MRLHFVFILFWVTVLGYGQDLSYSFNSIPKELLKSANSVLRYEKHIVEIPNQSTININHRRVLTVLNKQGDRDVDSYLYYDDVSRVKSITATFYDEMGNEVEKYKQRDFKDVSAVDGISLYTDSRLLYINHTPTSYPYSMVLESETTSKNTVSIPTFYANSGYYSSTQEKYFEINYAPELGLKFKTFGNSQPIDIQESQGTLTLAVNDVPAIGSEEYSPGFRKIVGSVSIALNEFNLEGVDGDASDWNTFGQWINDNLLVETQELHEQTVASIQELVKDITDPVEKARKVYQYVQDRTRYISVQVGIGGWKPMLASQVDKLGYGDCKALTNYTSALLDAVDVVSYYTVLYGSDDKRDITNDFTSLQGNHAILSIPNDDGYIWLECTDQKVPFGFIAGFTDDRDVLVVKPTGGEIVHTKNYTALDNYQTMMGSYDLNEYGDVNATVEIVSGGLQYGNRYRLEEDTNAEKKKYYYKFWDYLNNIAIDSVSVSNNKEAVKFSENVSFQVKNYATVVGEELLVTMNFFNRFSSVPERIKKRLHAVEVDRGFKDVEEIEINLPPDFEVVTIAEEENITTVFGAYNVKIKKLTDNKLAYSRTFEFYNGSYTASQYGDFRKFLQKVARADKQKMIIKKIK